MRRSHTFSIAMARDYHAVYAYLAEPLNFPQWAAIEGGSFGPLANGDWAGQTPFGFRHFRFTPHNAFGVLDHAIFKPDGPLLYTPMRVMANDEGTELSFIFFQRDGMSDAQFASSIEWIMTDFLALKSLLEAMGQA